MEENEVCLSTLLCQQMNQDQIRVSLKSSSSLTDSIQILAVDCGKRFLSQLALPELHLDSAACASRLGSLLRPLAGERTEGGGGVQRQDHGAGTCRDGRSLCILPRPSLLTSPALKVLQPHSLARLWP